MDGEPDEQGKESSEHDGRSSEDGTIRVVALGIVRRHGVDGERATGTNDGGRTELLVSRHRNPETGEAFYRPLGGGVEFGEHGEDALRREFREELGVSLETVSLLDTYEDVFDHEGETHHELWRCYEVEIVEDWPYENESFAGYESEADEEEEKFECVWKPISELGPEDGERETFYPSAALSEL